MRKQKTIIANWKMNPTTQKEAVSLIDSIKKELKPISKKIRDNNIKIVICPPTIYLSNIKEKIIQNTYIDIGAQNCSIETKGTLTGETSPAMLKDIHCKWVIIGHSERRLILNETSDLISKKLKLTIKEGLNPILCIGDQGTNNTDKLENEVNECLKNIEKKELGLGRTIYIAYEPESHIGTGTTPDSNQILQSFLLIKKIFADKYGTDIIKNIKLIYGGSVNEKAVSSLEQAQPDGYLIGSASLNAWEFGNIVKKIISKK